MKKFFAISLAIVMILSLSITAFAASHVNALGGTKDLTVAATYTYTDNNTPVYGVDIAWTAVAFEFTVAQGTWNPDTLNYNADAAGVWDETSKDVEITVTNKSNAAITATATFAGELATAEFDGAATVEAAEVGQEKTGTITGTITINNDAVITEAATVGTITVTITAG